MAGLKCDKERPKYVKVYYLDDSVYEISHAGSLDRI